jgi:hypothetical protein
MCKKVLSIEYIVLRLKNRFEEECRFLNYI